MCFDESIKFKKSGIWILILNAPSSIKNIVVTKLRNTIVPPEMVLARQTTFTARNEPWPEEDGSRLWVSPETHLSSFSCLSVASHNATAFSTSFKLLSLVWLPLISVTFLCVISIRLHASLWWSQTSAECATSNSSIAVSFGKTKSFVVNFSLITLPRQTCSLVKSSVHKSEVVSRGWLAVVPQLIYFTFVSFMLIAFQELSCARVDQVREAEMSRRNERRALAATAP